MSFQESAMYELHFWLQVLGDHGRFIHDSLAPSEKEKIEIASSFIKRFDKLLEASKTPLDNQGIVELAKKYGRLSYG